MESLHLELCSGWPWAYRRALARAPCSDLGESESRGRVECTVMNLVPAMLLASSDPHHDFSIKILGARIELWPMNLPCHRCILTDTAVDARIVVRLERFLRVEVEVCGRLALFGQNPCLELGARLAIM